MIRALVAPLDWGLGHATRCIRIIHELENQGCKVSIASSGNALKLLQKEFPFHEFHALPAYDPVYPKNGSMVFTMAKQLPKFVKVIRQEHLALKKVVEDNAIDVVISDNRYGCWSDKVPSVLITHQSNILMPRRFGWLSSIVRKINQQQMSNFTECWIPDSPVNSLAGELASFERIKDVAFKHIGTISRFKSSKIKPAKFDILAIMSGPEPQRTVLEKIVTSQLKKSSFTYLVVQGLPFAEPSAIDRNVVPYLVSGELQDAIESCRVVIARSGYSTIMDLAALNKNAILIPTRGQTEQEHLAAKLKGEKKLFSMSQNEFDLDIAMNCVNDFSGFNDFEMNSQLLETEVRLLLEKISNR
jgi:uncharacterized protein (TIGR00661 family)